jgi:hypothetical protein
MDSNDGGWTIVYSASGADGEQPLVSNTEASGDPLEFMNFNLNHAQKMVLSSLSTESLFKRNTGPWIKTNHALFDQSLSSNTHQHYSVTVESSDGQSVSGWMGYSTINIAHGGDFNVTTTDGKACSYNTNQGVDHHSSSYYHLNCGCQRHYLYSFSSPQGDGDAGYDVHTGLGAWTATQSCDGEEGGTLKFYAAMR